ncbi:MAG: hypothetical protein DRP74_07215 [Candidatus Omnitrophota bacterium]|nr:MAG: hypothetical protein DRP74_07215 [Candidatus Omnitrophota bacterium]
MNFLTSKKNFLGKGVKRMKRVLILLTLAFLLIGTVELFAQEDIDWSGNEALTDAYRQSSTHVKIIYDVLGQAVQQLRETTTIIRKMSENGWMEMTQVQTVAYEWAGGALAQTKIRGESTYEDSRGSSTETSTGIDFHYNENGIADYAEGIYDNPDPEGENFTSITTGSRVNSEGVKTFIEGHSTDEYKVVNNRWEVKKTVSVEVGYADKKHTKPLTRETTTTEYEYDDFGNQHLLTKSTAKTSKETYNDETDEWVESDHEDEVTTSYTYELINNEYRVMTETTDSTTWGSDGTKTVTTRVLTYERNEKTGLVKGLSLSMSGYQIQTVDDLDEILLQLQNYNYKIGESDTFGYYVEEEEYDFIPVSPAEEGSDGDYFNSEMITFGAYYTDPDSGEIVYVQLSDKNGNPIDDAEGMLKIYQSIPAGTILKYYIKVDHGDYVDIWHQDRGLNSDRQTHLKIERIDMGEGDGEILKLKWEDLYGGGDKDFNDLIIYIGVWQA